MTFGAFLSDYVKLYLEQNSLKSLGAINARILHELADRAYADYQAKLKVAKKQETAADWIDEMAKDPANEGINVREQLAKAQFWCKNNSRQCTRRFFVQWLLKADRSLAPSAANKGPISADPYQEPSFDWRMTARVLMPNARDWSNPIDFGLVKWSDLPIWMRQDILKKA